MNLGALASRRRVEVSSEERHASGTLALPGGELPGRIPSPPAATEKLKTFPQSLNDRIRIPGIKGGSLYSVPNPNPWAGTQSGTNVIISGTNNSGLAGSYYVLATTNVALPLSNWTRFATNAFVAGNFNFTNGVILNSTNVALPLSNWTRLQTNAFDANGNFSFTNAITTPQRFYLLQEP